MLKTYKEEVICKNCGNIVHISLEQNGYFKRYLNGAPKEKVVERLTSIYFCPHCHNVSVQEKLSSDHFDTLHKIAESNYQNIFKTDEPLPVKQNKTVRVYLVPFCLLQFQIKYPS